MLNFRIFDFGPLGPEPLGTGPTGFGPWMDPCRQQYLIMSPTWILSLLMYSWEKQFFNLKNSIYQVKKKE